MSLLIIDQSIKYEREDAFKDKIVLKIKEPQNRFIYLVGIQRQEKVPRESPSNTLEGIARQVARLKSCTKKITEIANLGHDLVVAGDMNIDWLLPNDLLLRPELRALYPVLDDFLLYSSITQLNTRPTRHQIGHNSSLLNLFLANIPNRITNVDKLSPARFG